MDDDGYMKYQRGWEEWEMNLSIIFFKSSRLIHKYTSFSKLKSNISNDLRGIRNTILTPGYVGVFKKIQN